MVLSRTAAVEFVPAQAPPQPPKNDPAAGDSVSVRDDPWSHWPVQVAPQAMPAGALATVPVPCPALLMVSPTWGTGVSVGVAVGVAVGGIGVSVGVAVGGIGVFVGVAVGGIGVFVGVEVGGTGVFVAVFAGVCVGVDGIGVGVGVARPGADTLYVKVFVVLPPRLSSTAT